MPMVLGPSAVDWLLFGITSIKLSVPTVACELSQVFSLRTTVKLVFSPTVGFEFLTPTVSPVGQRGLPIQGETEARRLLWAAYTAVSMCHTNPYVCKLGRLHKGAQPFPEHMVFHDIGVSNILSTLKTISDLCVIIYRLHVRMNVKCSCNILMDVLMSI
ncbi:hypothetical protein SORBI_3003G180600 [Sorghum bicolor]|uniref:Uncharacterized protein n=1 Tax=Sorghum bicolor TaxID=4558 RepID=A0A1B6Q3Z6_SORBI|nr:hypothetical protein SORBI_3003G180600 [Sorghum bicolor]